MTSVFVIVVAFMSLLLPPISPPKASCASCEFAKTKLRQVDTKAKLVPAGMELTTSGSHEANHLTSLSVLNDLESSSIQPDMM